MAAETLEEFYLEELKDVLSAEQQLTKALPKMAKKASNPELSEAFEMHLRETETQIERLNRVFELLGEKPRAKKCEAMAGLLEEGDHVMKEVKDPQVLNVALIAAAQKVEHYEIATYGTLRALAALLGHRDHAALFAETLQEEKNTDAKLNGLAKRRVNPEAAAESGEKSARPARGRTSTSGNKSRRGMDKKGAANRGKRTTSRK